MEAILSGPSPLARVGSSVRRRSARLGEVIDNAPTGWRSRSKVEEFAERFAARHGVKYAVPVNSGTTAIHSALAAIDPEPGDEVISTPTTDIGGVLGIMLQNCVPVFADWDPDTYSTAPADIEARITGRPRAILATHLFGNPCDMDAIMEIGCARRAHLRQVTLPVRRRAG